MIPRSTRLAEAPSFGQPIIYYDKYSSGAAAYELLAQEVLTRVEKMGANVTNGAVPALPEGEVGRGQLGALEDPKLALAWLPPAVAELQRAPRDPRADDGAAEPLGAQVEGPGPAERASDLDVIGDRIDHVRIPTAAASARGSDTP